MSENLKPIDFPFAAARRITSEEVAAAKLAVKELFEIDTEKVRSTRQKAFLGSWSRY